jgi:formylglycine-generating enzyme required for sulfatase activity
VGQQGRAGVGGRGDRDAREDPAPAGSRALKTIVSGVVGAAIAAVVAAAAPASTPMARVGPGVLRPVYVESPGMTEIAVAQFELDRVPVTNAGFSSFVSEQPRWRRDRVPALLADAGYLAHWATATEPGADAEAEAPVTRVSWFAAKAYCAAEGKRLPTEAEWELAAAAGRHGPDWRAEPEFAATLLATTMAPAAGGRRRVGQQPPNFWGVHDLHGLAWEWVLDFNGTLVTGDSRDGKSAETLRFCGVGALAAGDKSDYAGFLRAAFRSALQARYTASALGFRCARDVEAGAH